MNRWRKLCPTFDNRRVLIRCIGIITGVFITVSAQFPIAVVALEVSANAAIAMDSSSGTVLFEKNSRQKLGMASTTKIMTALVALEKCKLDEIVKTSKNAAHVEGSSMYLSEGEEQTMENMLYGLLLNSGNDAATAIAEHISGNTAAFAKLMTQRANELGAKDTSFANPHGLHSSNHYTTAYDLALITKQALKNAKFAEIVKTQSKIVPWPGHEWGKTLNNQNKMLKMYEGCDGVKPGFTPETGRTLVTSATKNGWQVIAVTLNDRDDWKDHTNMFDYCFNTYDFKKVIEKGVEQCSLKVWDGVSPSVSCVNESGFGFPYLKGGSIDVKTKVDVPKNIKAPVAQGQKLGEVSIIKDGKQVTKVPLVAKSVVEKRPNGNLFSLIIQWLLSLVGLAK